MPAHSRAQVPLQHSGGEKKYFTVDQANRALPYVRRIAKDIRQCYRRAVTIQHRLEHPLAGEEREQLEAEYESVVEALNRHVDELHEVGVEIKDYDLGLVDFPAWHEGREVCLCWRPEEEQILAWHEMDAGFAGRQDISTLG